MNILSWTDRVGPNTVCNHRRSMVYTKRRRSISCFLIQICKNKDTMYFLLLLLPINDLLQQFEDYVNGIAELQKRQILTNKKISLKICTYKCTCKR